MRYSWNTDEYFNKWNKFNLFARNHKDKGCKWNKSFANEHVGSKLHNLDTLCLRKEWSFYDYLTRSWILFQHDNGDVLLLGKRQDYLVRDTYLLAANEKVNHFLQVLLRQRLWVERTYENALVGWRQRSCLSSHLSLQERNYRAREEVRGPRLWEHIRTTYVRKEENQPKVKVYSLKVFRRNNKCFYFWKETITITILGWRAQQLKLPSAEWRHDFNE